MSEPIKVIIAEDHPLYREALVKELKPYNIYCAGEAANGNELLMLLETHRKGIVLLDLEMPEMSGQEALFVILEKFPLVKVLITSQYDDNNIIEHYKELGVSGYMPKNYISGDVKALADAIFDIRLGKRCFVFRADDNKYVKYTKRERELIPLICEGKTSKEIASTLGVVEKTIEKHRTKLLEKTDSKNVASFIKYSIKRGLDFLRRK